MDRIKHNLTRIKHNIKRIKVPTTTKKRNML